MYSLRFPTRSFRARAICATAVIATMVGFSGQCLATPALEALLAGAGPVRVATAEVNDAVRAVYQARQFEPLWPAGPRRDRLLAVLGDAASEGLDADAYLTPVLRDRLAAGAADELDVLLTDAALRYAHDQRVGRIGPDQVDVDWQHARNTFDTVAFVAKLAQSDDQLSPLADLAPPYMGYQRLRHALANMRKLQQAGGWPAIPAVGKDSIRPGMQDDRVPFVRKRLKVTGEYTGTDLEGTTLDDALSHAIMRFQAHHGLDVDGVLGRGTAEAMSMTAEQRVNQLAANLERWRWLPRRLEPQHVVVNIGGQYLELVKDGEVVLQTKVVVGKPDHRTVAFRAAITSVTLNPPWNVPDSIASKEILPELKRNPDYLAHNRLQIVGASAPDSDADIDWHSYSRFPYQLRQTPGVGNSLGVVKFNMPNGNDIYLHDTPSKGLFQRARRAFSHGCVRVQDPVRLAATLIDKEDYAPDKIKDRIKGGNTQTVQLAKPLPIYLFYFTAWVDSDGKLELRDDIYGYDRGISSQMAKLRQKVTQNDKNQQSPG